MIRSLIYDWKPGLNRIMNYVPVEKNVLNKYYFRKIKEWALVLSMVAYEKSEISVSSMNY